MSATSVIILLGDQVEVHWDPLNTVNPSEVFFAFFFNLITFSTEVKEKIGLHDLAPNGHF